MLLYKDIFTNEEIFTDAQKYKEVDDLYYLVEGHMELGDEEIDDSLIGGNKSAEAEEEDQGPQDVSVKVSNLIKAGKLEKVETLVSKKDFKVAISAYCKKLVKKVSETNPERASELKTKLMDFVVGSILPEFKTYAGFYATYGDQFDLEGMLIPYKQDDELGLEKVGSKCYIIVFKDGCEEEKL